MRGRRGVRGIRHAARPPLHLRAAVGGRRRLNDAANSRISSHAQHADPVGTGPVGERRFQATGVHHLQVRQHLDPRTRLADSTYRFHPVFDHQGCSHLDDLHQVDQLAAAGDRNLEIGFVECQLQQGHRCFATFLVAWPVAGTSTNFWARLPLMSPQ